MKELSIIIATHDRPKELARCLESIRNCNLRSCEVVLIADKRKQETTDVAAKYLTDSDHYVIRGGTPGAAVSRNLGLTVASGRHIVIMDDDDAFPEVGYQDFVDQALSNPGTVVYSDVNIIEEDRKKGEILPVPPRRVDSITRDFSEIYIKNFIFTQACIFPAEAIRGVPMDTHMRTFVDWEFLLAVASRTPFRPVNCVGATIYKDYINEGYRHSTSDVMRNYELVLDYLYVYRRWPAKNEQQQAMRSAMLANAGLNIAPQYL